MILLNLDRTRLERVLNISDHGDIISVWKHKVKNIYGLGNNLGEMYFHFLTLIINQDLNMPIIEFKESYVLARASRKSIPVILSDLLD